MLWDIFCKVIDNYGDIGVCWRLSAELGERGHQVRLWVDDASALAWMAPQGHAAVTVLPWDRGDVADPPGEVVIEAFGCDLPEGFVRAIAAKTARDGRQPVWINLEYLSAESYVERSHGLPSPVSHGPAAGLTKHFFYPGFSPTTGGLLRERALDHRQATFLPHEWLRRNGIEPGPGQRISLFCYEPEPLGHLLRLLAGGDATQLLVTAGRTQTAVTHAVQQLNATYTGWNAAGRLSISYLPHMRQEDYDHLLWSCELNFVRGEDSLVRALWAGRPFVWNIYPQHDSAHEAKLEAFLDWLQAPQSLRQFHRAWNGVEGVSLPCPELASWSAAAELALRRARLLPELAGSLEDFARRQATI